MKKKSKARFWWWISILVIALAAILAAYFLGMEEGRKEAEKPADVKPLPAKKQDPLEQPAVAKGPIPFPEPAEVKPSDQGYCENIDQQVQEYFGYLNAKAYVRHLDENLNTYARFKTVIRKLSERVPIPAGEGVDSEIINDNIFFFFRVLDNQDYRLIRDILKNESEALETTLELFYTWLTLGNRCPDPEGIRPSRSVLYHYAGFFLNTIGGRSYLFRRAPALRLLCTYYCLLVLHEADKQGMNSYGIDIFPFISPLAGEIALYSDFRFKETYLKNLGDMEKEYVKKRQ